MSECTPGSHEGVRAFAQYWRRGTRAATTRTTRVELNEPLSRSQRQRRPPRRRKARGPTLEFIRGSVDIEDDVDPAGGHPVLEALLARKRSGSVPGERTDGMRIGLAVEGGGMKGVISAGACGEILRAGFADCFDAVYGSSAGAMNLTYYLANQPEGIRAYEEDLVDGGFLDLRRLPALNRGRKGRKGKRNEDGSDDDDEEEKVQPAMDVSYLVDGVMDGTTNRALRWDLLMNSRVPLKVVATSLDTLTPVVLEGPWRGVEDLKQCLKASAAVPTLAGPEPVMWRGQRLVDAAVMEPVPVHAAIADGCTHVLVLCTRSLPPLGEKRTESVSSEVSSVPPSSITADSLVPAAAGTVDLPDQTGACSSRASECSSTAAAAADPRRPQPAARGTSPWGTAQRTRRRGGNGKTSSSARWVACCTTS